MYNHQNMSSFVLLKPKKDVGSYIGLIKNKDESEPSLKISGYCIGIQEEKRSTILYMKSSLLVDFLNTTKNEFCTIVKDNSKDWFGKQMDDELLNEYFLDNVVYDKKYGQVIRILLNSTNTEDLGIKHKYFEATLILKQIRFYKQKFQIEFNIENINTLSEDDHYDEFDEDDVAMPPIDVVHDIKKEYLEKLSQLEELRKKLIKVDSTKSIVDICSKIKDVILNFEPILE